MIELGLIGAGAMGMNHARVALALRDARLSVVVDPDEKRGRPVAERAGARYSSDLQKVLGMIDAAIVAVPTGSHFEIVMELLEAGIHVLVEKPIASSPDQGRKLVSAAEAASRVLMVGHVERFNPAVLQLDDIVSEPIHLAAQRISPFAPHIDDGVTLDLMIHDLDLVASLVRSPVSRVQAVTRDVHGPDDLTVALLEFANGTTADLTASRLGQEKIRDLSITQRDNFVKVDLIRQSVSIHRVGRIESGDSGAIYRQSGIVEVPFLRYRGEPLLLELEHFTSCVVAGTTPRVTGEDGVAALELVAQVRHAAHLKADLDVQP
jgi:predicted dehydrogenase